MELKHVTETEEGTVTFQGVLEGPELMIVVETGLNELMKRGLVPFAAAETFDLMNIMDVPEQTQ